MAVSAHSGLREEVELKMMEEKAADRKEKYEERMNIVRGVLDAMPRTEQLTFLANLVRLYK